MRNNQTFAELTVSATLENLGQVQAFIEEQLEQAHCPTKSITEVSIAVEEIYVNIAHYAYRPEIGEATVRCRIMEAPLRVTIQFLDCGLPFDPLQKPDADTTLSTDDRPIGGLGILMVKRIMDNVGYAYENGTNILTLQKQIKK